MRACRERRPVPGDTGLRLTIWRHVVTLVYGGLDERREMRCLLNPRSPVIYPFDADVCPCVECELLVSDGLRNLAGLCKQPAGVRAGFR